jgi:hypothetical protein
VRCRRAENEGHGLRRKEDAGRCFLAKLKFIEQRLPSK